MRQKEGNMKTNIPLNFDEIIQKHIAKCQKKTKLNVQVYVMLEKKTGHHVAMCDHCIEVITRIPGPDHTIEILDDKCPHCPVH